VTAVEGFSHAADFLSHLVGKPISVMLVNYDWRDPHLLGGILTHVYTNAILLTRQNREQLIYLQAVAMIEENTSDEQSFQAKIATVQATANSESSGNDLSAKYIGE
jgi:hypothetical protein